MRDSGCSALHVLLVESDLEAFLDLDTLALSFILDFANLAFLWHAFALVILDLGPLKRQRSFDFCFARHLAVAFARIVRRMRMQTVQRHETAQAERAGARGGAMAGAESEPQA